MKLETVGVGWLDSENIYVLQVTQTLFLASRKRRDSTQKVFSFTQHSSVPCNFTLQCELLLLGHWVHLRESPPLLMKVGENMADEGLTNRA